MMTKANPKTQQAQGEWTKIFPQQATENYTSSVTFMKQLTTVAVSTITFVKNAFSAENYSVQPFSGLKIRILKEKCEDEMAQFISTALVQAFDAFDKKYLHQLALCFYERDCNLDNLVEYHVFEYVYKDDGVTMSISSKHRGSETSIECTLENVMAMTSQLIRTCVVMMNAHPQRLPDDYDVSIRLYYNENTPEGYQAPGYLHSLDQDDPLVKSFNDTVMKMGCVETPFHKLALRTYIKDSARASCEVNLSQRAPGTTESQSENQRGDRSGSTIEVDHGSQVPLRCACEKDKFDPHDALDTLLTCQYCRTQQHAVCYGLTSQQAALMTSHCCVTCSDNQPTRSPTDPRLYNMEPRKRNCVAIYRRALAWCAQSSSVAMLELCDRFDLSPVNASKLMKLLHTNGIIRRQTPYSDLTTPSTIIHDQLKAVMAQYFNTDENNILSRLMNETFASSQETLDPVGKVLTPIEKESLQNASNIGRVIDNPPNENIEDSTLKQYRKALILVERVDVEPLKWTNSMETLGKKRKAEDVENDKKAKGGVKSKKLMRKA